MPRSIRIRAEKGYRWPRRSRSVVCLHQPPQVHRIDRSRKSAVGLMDVIAHRFCAGDTLFANRDGAIATHSPGQQFVKQCVRSLAGSV
jgi:hypothetical protein